MEPSGPVQACNGIALPFYLLMEYVRPEGEKLGVWFCKDETWFHFDG